MKSKVNILVITSWSISEPLIQSYTLPNLRLIKSMIDPSSVIYVSTFEKTKPASDSGDHEFEYIHLPYANFGIKALFLYAAQFIRLLFFIRRKKITHIHAFAPVAGALGLALKILTDKRLIIDSWEPHADCMVETGTWRKNSLAYKILFYSEKKQAQKADVLIAAAPSMLEYAHNNFGKTHAVIAYRPAWVDLEKFKRSEVSRQRIRKQHSWEKKIVCACVSKIGGLYLKEDVFRIISLAETVFGESFHFLLLSANQRGEVDSLREQFGVNPDTITHMVVPHNEVVDWLSACDFALNPQQPVPSKHHGTPVKDGEYWAMGLPLMILPDISEDSDIVVKEKVGVIFNSLSEEDIKSALIRMKELLSSDEAIHQRSRETAITYRNKTIAEKAYKTIYTIE